MVILYHNLKIFKRNSAVSGCDVYRSEFGLSDKTERRDASKKFFLLGGQKVKELQAKLPTNIEVFFVGMDNSPINSRTFST